MIFLAMILLAIVLYPRWVNDGPRDWPIWKRLEPITYLYTWWLVYICAIEFLWKNYVQRKK